MSGLCEAWAWNVTEVRGTAKFVLVFLARKAYYDDGRAAWPSLATIGEHCGCDERTVRRALAWLQEERWIEPGDQDFSAKDPRTGRTIRAGHRSTVWNVNMKHVHIDPEDIEEHDGAVKPESYDSPAGVVESPSALEGRPDNLSPHVRPDRLSSLTDSRVDNLSTRPDRLSTKRLITNNYPSPPTGDLPTGEAPPKRISNRPETDPDADARSLCASMVERMRSKPRLPVPARLDDGSGGVSKRELSAARRLVAAHGLERCRLVAEWALRAPESQDSKGFSWRGCITGPSRLERKWDSLLAQMACDPQGSRLLDRSKSDPVDAHRPIRVTSRTCSRTPVFGAGIFDLNVSQDHLDGLVRQADCPLCAFDERNREHHHGGDAVRAAATVEPSEATLTVASHGSRFKGSKDYVGDKALQRLIAEEGTTIGGELG